MVITRSGPQDDAGPGANILGPLRSIMWATIWTIDRPDYWQPSQVHTLEIGFMEFGLGGDLRTTLIARERKEWGPCGPYILTTERKPELLYKSKMMNRTSSNLPPFPPKACP
jgi:hypothetical protein